jgi:hypothetical protein
VARDFSGDYVLDRSASVLSAGAAGFCTGEFHIRHLEPTFHLSAKLIGRDKTFEYSYELTTDGREVRLGENDLSRLYWDGDVLVAEHRGPALAMIWRYELMEDRRLRAVEQIRGAGRDQDNTWIFDRA